MLLQIFLTMLLVPYSFWLIFFYKYHLVDGANLLFHEAGHIIFGFMGETIHFLGGTLGQLIFPVACIISFIMAKKSFEAAACGIWLGESLMNIAYYIRDAQAQLLPLVGGGTHDWNWLLLRAGLLDKCKPIASTVHFIASLIVVLCNLFILLFVFDFVKIISNNAEEK